jgi:vacuolar-type H+-ATPase subunit H
MSAEERAKLVETARRRWPIRGPNHAEAELVHSLADALAASEKELEEAWAAVREEAEQTCQEIKLRKKAEKERQAAEEALRRIAFPVGRKGATDLQAMARAALPGPAHKQEKS